MAVYTNVSISEIKSFLEKYNIGDFKKLTPIAQGIENSNYFLETTENKFILTLYEKRVNPQELPYFLDLMAHLKDKGIVCPLPVLAKNGQPLQDLKGKKACITTFLSGKMVEEITPNACYELGVTMAKMHKASSDFKQTRKNDLSLDGWINIANKIKGSADNVCVGLSQKIEEVLQELKRDYPKENSLPSGVIHADLFPDNVFFENEKLSGVIDFYFACDDFFAYEIAVCINAWCFDDKTWAFNRDKANSLMTGYQSVRLLQDCEKQALPILLKGASLRFLLTRTYDWLHQSTDALVTVKDPMEYVQKLYFHQKNNSSKGHF